MFVHEPINMKCYFVREDTVFQVIAILIHILQDEKKILDMLHNYLLHNTSCTMLSSKPMFNTGFLELQLKVCLMGDFTRRRGFTLSDSNFL
jgi:hypothetical protein